MADSLNHFLQVVRFRLKNDSGWPDKMEMLINLTYNLLLNSNQKLRRDNINLCAETSNYLFIGTDTERFMILSKIG
jgi:hypothetical protein